MLIAIVGALHVPAAHAQRGRTVIDWKLDRRTCQVGEPFELRLVCVNADGPEAPPLPPIEGLDITLLTPAPQHFSSTTIINGRRSQETTDTFLYRVVGLKAGEYTLPAVEVTAGRRTFTTSPLTLTITPAPAESDNLADRFMFASLVVDAESVYVTESVTATLRVGVRKLTVNGQEVEVDLWRNIVGSGTVNLSVFANVEPSLTTATMRDSNGDRHAYQVYRFDVTLRAEQADPLLIGPVFIAWSYPTEVRARRDFFAISGQRLEVVRSQHTTARAQAVSVQVKAPPSDGQPESYNGAIGRYRLDVDVKPDVVELGQPVTLNVSIRGRPLDGVAGPDLSRQPDLVSRFDFRRDEVVGEMKDGAKTFRQAIFPKQEGRQTVPPIEWTYFDTRDERYVTLTSEPITLNVLPPKSAPTQMMVLDAPDTQRDDGPALTPAQGGGISPNYVDPALVLASRPFVLGWQAAATLIVPPVLLAALLVTRRRQARLRDDAAYRRRRSARRTAEARLADAARAAHEAEQVASVAAAVRGFIADVYNLPSGAMTADDVRRALGEAGLAPALVSEIAEFLETCDAARYAGGTAIAAAAATDAADAPAGGARGDSHSILAAEVAPGADDARRVREWMSQIEAAAR